MKHKYIAVIHAGLATNNQALKYAEMLAPIIDRRVVIIYPSDGELSNADHEVLRMDLWKDESLWDSLLVDMDISFFLFEIGKSGLSLNKTLIQLRHLRVPYLAVPSTLTEIVAPKLFIVPLGVLPEEKEKGVFTSALAKKTGAAVCIITAKAYGSRARQNTQAVIDLLQKQELRTEVVVGKKSSEKVDFEGLYAAERPLETILWISATREYALDDLVFGTKELRLLRKSNMPVMIINPRGDLYAFCE